MHTESTTPRPRESKRLKSTPASTAAWRASGTSLPRFRLSPYASRGRLMRSGPTTVLVNLSRPVDIVRKYSFTEHRLPLAVKLGLFSRAETSSTVTSVGVSGKSTRIVRPWTSPFVRVKPGSRPLTGPKVSNDSRSVSARFLLRKHLHHPALDHFPPIELALSQVPGEPLGRWLGEEYATGDEPAFGAGAVGVRVYVGSAIGIVDDGVAVQGFVPCVPCRHRRRRARRRRPLPG